MVVLGILFSYVVGAFVSWQWLAIISAFVPVIMLILMIYVPASPRYLLQKGQTAEASKALAWFRGAESSQHVEAELKLVSGNSELLFNVPRSFSEKIKSHMLNVLM